MSNKDFKKCRFCQEEIHAKAQICFHCGKYQNQITESFRRFTTNGISIILLILTGVQLYMASQEKSRATEAADKATKALKEIEGIQNNIQIKDRILKALIKANFENLYIARGTSLAVDFKNEKETIRKEKENDNTIIEIIEPDSLKRKVWLDSLKLLIYY